MTEITAHIFAKIKNQISLAELEISLWKIPKGSLPIPAHMTQTTTTSSDEFGFKFDGVPVIEDGTLTNQIQVKLKNFQELHFSMLGDPCK